MNVYQLNPVNLTQIPK